MVCLTLNRDIMAILYPTRHLVDSYFNSSFHIDEINLGSIYQNPSGQFSLHNISTIGNLPIVSNPAIIGIDLPVLLANNNSSKDIVIILGQDPARDPNDPYVTSLHPTLPDDVVVGTPYAVHLPNSYKGVKLYHDIFDIILKKDNNIYLTDILKFHTKSASSGVLSNDFNKYFRGQIKQVALGLLNDEIKYLLGNGYNVKGVVLFGGVANSIASIFSGYPVVTLPHPSPSANGTWKKIFPICNNQNKKQYIENTLRTNNVI